MADPMSYSLKAFCEDLQDRLDWLAKEVDRMETENEQLKRENKTLREETTLARLFRDLSSEEGPALLPERMPATARQLYDLLPAVISFDEFFNLAGERGIAYDQAKDFLLVLLREDLLAQTGRSLRKQEQIPFANRRPGQG